jgi:amidohydrolase/hippurate hydrolase
VSAPGWEGAGEGPNAPRVHNPYYDFNHDILPQGVACRVEPIKQPPVA